MIKRSLILPLLLLCSGTFAQIGTNPNYMTSRSVIALDAGYEYFKYHGMQLGIAKAKYSKQGKMVYGKGFGLAGEILIDTIAAYGPKLSCWMNGGVYHLSFGAWTAYYFSQAGSSFRACPQIGVGSKRWRVNYGYSFSITGRELQPFVTHTFSLNILVDLFTLKTGELGADKSVSKKKKRKNGYQNQGFGS